MESVYVEFGGEAGIRETVEYMYNNVLRDPGLAPFFVDVNMARQRQKFEIFLHILLDAGEAPSAESMHSTHGPSVNEGLSHEHFDVFTGHLERAMRELDVPDHLVEHVSSNAEAYRRAVLNL